MSELCPKSLFWLGRPGNVIVVGGKSKISDLEFAKARKIGHLQELTKKPKDSFVPVMVDTCTLSCFVSAFMCTFSTLTGHG